MIKATLARMTEINLRPFLRPKLDVLFVPLNAPTNPTTTGITFPDAVPASSIYCT